MGSLLTWLWAPLWTTVVSQPVRPCIHSEGKAFIFSHGGRAVLSQLLYFAQVCFPFFLLGTCLTDKLELCSASLACIEKQG